jgi:hypothetical protein
MRRITTEDSFHGYSVSRSRKKDKGLRVEMLESIERFLDYIKSEYNRAFFFSFNVNFPAGYLFEYQRNNDLFSRYIEALTRYWYRKGYRPMYFWARELSPKTKQFHYHVIFVVDGDRVWRDFKMQVKAKQLWEHSLRIEEGTGPFRKGKSFRDGKYDKDGNYSKFSKFPQSGGTMIQRKDLDFDHMYRRCFDYMTYFAKVYSKGKSAAYVNEYGHSRIPRR